MLVVHLVTFCFAAGGCETLSQLAHRHDNGASKRGLRARSLEAQRRQSARHKFAAESSRNLYDLGLGLPGPNTAGFA